MRRTPQRLLALVFLFAAGLGFTLLPAAPRAHADNICTPDSSWGTVNSGYASQVITLVNQHRASLGLGQLSSDAALTRSAVWKSMNMAGLNYFDHNDDPIGRSVGQRLSDCGWPSNLGWGENIAYGYPTPDQVMSGWLNSPGHKANIENPSFTTIGVGVAANAQGGYYWTQDFGQGSSGGAPPPPTTTTPPPPPTTTTPPPPPPPTTTTPPPTTTRPTTTTTPTTTAPTTTTRSTTTTPSPTTTSAGETTTAAVPVAGSAPAPAAKPKAHPKHLKKHKPKRHKPVVHIRRLDFLKLNELRHL
ncbi:MAG TPA: CAP domain-containing protein [Gaiellaceae bacterium]|nr:CAP domain-containing protein [Gaiellaceae bacterium]